MSETIRFPYTVHAQLTLTGDLIRYLRQHRGLTQGELAKRIGVTRQTVNKWERGVTTPADPEPVIRLLEITNPDFAAIEEKTLINPQVFTVKDGLAVITYRERPPVAYRVDGWRNLTVAMG
jgi:transcriptional regulator with XRE-family HTH domain